YGADIFGAAIQSIHDHPFFESEFGGDDDLIAEGREGFADYFFVEEGAIAFRGVEEGHAFLVCGADQVDRLRFVDCGSEAETETHTAQTEGGDFQIAFS